MSVFTANLLLITENAKENGRKMRKKNEFRDFPPASIGKNLTPDAKLGLSLHQN